MFLLRQTIGYDHTNQALYDTSFTKLKQFHRLNVPFFPSLLTAVLLQRRYALPCPLARLKAQGVEEILDGGRDKWSETDSRYTQGK